MGWDLSDLHCVGREVEDQVFLRVVVNVHERGTHRVWRRKMDGDRDGKEKDRGPKGRVIACITSGG